MTTDQEVIVSLNLLYKSEADAGLRATAMVMTETKAQLDALGIASVKVDEAQKGMTESTKVARTEFQSLSKAAGTEARAAVDALALAIYKGETSLDGYVVSAREATVASNLFAKSQRDAAAMVAGANAETAAAGVAARSSAAGMGEMGAASRLASGNLDLLGVAALGAKGNFALLGAAVGAYAVYEGARLQSSLTETRNNTTMTTAQFGQMRTEILKLGAESPIALDALAAGYRQISDTGFQGAAANKLMEVSMKSASSTGADFATVATTLATVMHAMGASANEAGHYMDVLHLAANEGRLTLQDMAQVFGVVSTYASEAGISVEDTAAAIAAMTRNGLDATSAATQFKDSVLHIINPGKQARDEIAMLSHQTGVDLVHDFSQAGLSAKGLFGVMGDVKTATNGNVQEMARLIPNMRGLLAEMILTGKGAKDYATILGQLKDAHGQTDEAYKRSQQTLSFYLGTLHNQLVIYAADWGEKALPAIQAYVHFVESYAIPEFKLLAWSISGVTDKVVGGADKVNNLAQVLGGWGNTVNGIIPVNHALAFSYDHIHGSIASVLAEQERERKLMIEGTKEIDAQTKALNLLAQAKHDVFSATPGTQYQFGPGARPGYGPGGDTTMYSSYPGVRSQDMGTANYLQNAIKAAGDEVKKWQDIVAYDRDHNHAALKDDTAKLDEANQHYAALNKEMSDLAKSGLPQVQKAINLHSAQYDTLTRLQNDYQKALNAVTRDLAGPTHTATAEHIADLKEAKKRLDDMNRAVSDIVTPLKAFGHQWVLDAGLLGGLSGGRKTAAADIFASAQGQASLFDYTSLDRGAMDSPKTIAAINKADAALYSFSGQLDQATKQANSAMGRYERAVLDGAPSDRLKALWQDVLDKTGRENDLKKIEADATYKLNQELTGAADAARQVKVWMGELSNSPIVQWLAGKTPQINMPWGAPVTGNIAAPLPVTVVNPGSLGGLAGLGAAGTPDLGTGIGGIGVQGPVAPQAPGSIDVAGIQSAISQQSSEMSTAASLQSSRLQVIASTGQLQVDGLQAVVTATQDQTQVIQAQTSVDAAASAVLVSHITGQTGILQAMGAEQVQSIKDQGAIAADIKSGDTAKLAQDRQIAAIDERLSSENLAIARERALIDDQSAANQLQAAQDNLKLAQDKARVDAADAAAKYEVDLNTLRLHGAELEELTAQSKLQADMVQFLGILAQVPLPAGVLADMASVGTAAGHVSLWQSALQDSTIGQGVINAQGQGVLANDSLQAALNASGGQQSLSSLQAVLAGMLQNHQVTQNQYDMLVAIFGSLQSIQGSTGQTATNTSQTASNTATIAAQNEEIQTLKERLRNASDPGTNRQIVIHAALPGAWHPVNSRPQL